MTPLDTHGYLGGGGIVFSNEAGNLEVISVSVRLKSYENYLVAVDFFETRHFYRFNLHLMEKPMRIWVENFSITYTDN